jgi:maltokinase
MHVNPIDEAELRRQRWFAGKDRDVRRIEAAGGIGDLQLADVRYADGGTERYLLSADGLRWRALLDALRAGPLTGTAGRLELRPGPALDALLDGAGDAQDVPSTDQTNTLVVVGGRLLVKAYRNLQAGVHPEIEICAALAGTGAPVPPFAGAIHLVAGDGADTAVALLQAFVPDAHSGWEAPIERAAAQLRARADRAEVAADHAPVGAMAAGLHRALAARLGTSVDPEAGDRWHAAALAVLTEAARLDPLARDHAGAATRALAALGDARALPVQRIHGDLHRAQLLGTARGLLAIDFEGDPTVPLDDRRAPDTPLRDLAALRRSIDHVGSAAARRAGADPAGWIAAATGAVLEGYEAHAGAAVDRTLLHALEVAAECRELVYAHRVVPEWAYVAHAGLARLLAGPDPEEHS